nr:hypothetical protein [Pseudomonas syringae]
MLYPLGLISIRDTCQQQGLDGGQLVQPEGVRLFRNYATAVCRVHLVGQLVNIVAGLVIEEQEAVIILWLCLLNIEGKFCIDKNVTQKLEVVMPAALVFLSISV